MRTAGETRISCFSMFSCFHISFGQKTRIEQIFGNAVCHVWSNSMTLFPFSTLAPDQICRAARHRTANGGRAEPQWRDPPGGQKYYSSYNIAPTSHTPVMFSKKHLPEASDTIGETLAGTEESDFVIQPMYWGLVPSWHKGDPKSIAYKMNNARSEGMLEKVSFKRPLEKGRRCVVLVDGYYEWHTCENGKKQPYFISAPLSKETRSTDSKIKKEVKTEPRDDNDETDSKEEMKMEPPDEDESPRGLLAMAGIFDVWHSKDEDGPLYSYSVITVESHKCVSFIHHRMPAILNGEEEILAWLDYESVPLPEAVRLIRGKDCLRFYPVSTLVNKVQNKSEECIKPIDLSKPDVTKSSQFMSGWLAKAGTSSTKKENINKESQDEGAKAGTSGISSIKKERVKEESGDESVKAGTSRALTSHKKARSSVKKDPKSKFSPQKSNLMTWLKTDSPRKNGRENEEPENKKSKS